MQLRFDRLWGGGGRLTRDGPEVTSHDVTVKKKKKKSDVVVFFWVMLLVCTLYKRCYIFNPSPFLKKMYLFKCDGELAPAVTAPATTTEEKNVINNLLFTLTSLVLGLFKSLQ